METRNRETTVSISELAQQERAHSEAAAQEIVTALKGTTTQTLTTPESSSPAPDETKAVPGIQILTNPAFVNEEKNGNKNDDAKTWKEKADKRKADKKPLRRS